MRPTFHRQQIISLIIVLMLPLFPLATTTGEIPQSSAGKVSKTSSYIVQASSAAVAKNFVIKAGGTVTATLNIIDAVGANLTREQTEWLRAQPDRIKIFDDGTLEISGRKPRAPKPKKNDNTEDPGPPPDKDTREMRNMEGKKCET